jgi:hypothetical protein
VSGILCVPSNEQKSKAAYRDSVNSINNITSEFLIFLIISTIVFDYMHDAIYEGRKIIDEGNQCGRFRRGITGGDSGSSMTKFMLRGFRGLRGVGRGGGVSKIYGLFAGLCSDKKE